MRDNDGLVLIIFITILAFVAFVGGCVGGDSAARNQMRKEAIKYGYATHNPKTGEWEWVKKEEATNAN